MPKRAHMYPNMGGMCIGVDYIHSTPQPCIMYGAPNTVAENESKQKVLPLHVTTATCVT